MQIPIYFTPTMTSKDFLQMLKGTAREGQGYEIACAQLCGNSHYRMKGYVTIETEQEFNEWLLKQSILRMKEMIGVMIGKFYLISIPTNLELSFLLIYNSIESPEPYFSSLAY